MKTVELIEHADEWTITMEGWTVTQCRVDSAFGLEFWEPPDISISIRIEGKFFYNSGVQQYELIAEKHASTLGPALQVFGKVIKAATAEKNGSLHLLFADYSSIVVPPSDEYEAWELNGPRGLQLVSLPGGDLGVWKPK